RPDSRPKGSSPQCRIGGESAMGTTFNPHPDESEQPPVRRLEEICVAFKAAWAAGQRPRIEEALEDTPAPERTALLPRLLSLELEVRRSRGEQPTLREYRKRFSEYATQVEEAFAAGKSLGETLDIRDFAGSPADS